MIEELFLDLYLIEVYECLKNSNIRVGSGNDRIESDRSRLFGTRNSSGIRDSIWDKIFLIDLKFLSLEAFLYVLCN